MDTTDEKGKNMTTIRTTEEILNEIQERVQSLNDALEAIKNDEWADFEDEDEKIEAIDDLIGDLWREIGEFYTYGGGSGWRWELRAIRRNYK